MAEIKRGNFGNMCPLVTGNGFKVIGITDSGVVIQNEAWYTGSVIAVDKMTTGGEKQRPLTGADMAWGVRTRVCANIKKCQYYDHGMETGWQDKVSKGKCMPTVIDGNSKATLEVELSS